MKVIPLSRANNVSIMLTQFSSFKSGPEGIRRALVTGHGLSLERLSLLLQASACCDLTLLSVWARNGSRTPFVRSLGPVGKGLSVHWQLQGQPPFQ